MRPYLAIIKDSFREAMASRILPFLLVLLTLVLLALAPLGWEEETGWRLRNNDIYNAEELLRQIDADRRAEGPTPGKQVWANTSQEFKDDVEELNEAYRKLRERQLSGDDNDRERIRVPAVDFVGEINRVLQKREFYDEAAWDEDDLPDEAQEYLDVGVENLTRTELARLNRLLFDAAYPNAIKPVSESQVYFEYAWWDFKDTLGPQTKSEAEQIVESSLSFISRYLVGKFGVFIAIIVSAGIIPRTFEAGSIDLLLSKPVFRWLLFLTKFFSGCAFIIINAGYFMAGVYLIAGLRFGIWDPNLLLAIPLFSFIFIIIYSISAIASVWWKNPIISAIVAIGFWLVCMGIGLVKNTVEQGRRTMMTVNITTADEMVIVSSPSSLTYVWNEDLDTWGLTQFRIVSVQQGLFGPQSQLVGPVYDPHARRLLAVEARTMMGRRAGPGRLLVSDLTDLSNELPIEGVFVPADVEYLFVDPDGEYIAAGRSGIYRLEGDPTIPVNPLDELFDPGADEIENEIDDDQETSDTDEGEPGEPGADGEAEEEEVERPIEPGRFEMVGPGSLSGILQPFAVGLDSTDGSIAVYDGGAVRYLKPNSAGEYDVENQRVLRKSQPGDAAKSALVGIGGDSILVVFEDGVIEVINKRTLKQINEFTPFEDHRPKKVVTSPDGRWFAVLFHEDKVCLYDGQSKKMIDPDEIDHQGDITAVHFPAEKRMMVADSFYGVSIYNLPTVRHVETLESETGVLEVLYKIVKFFYWVFPKPGDLDQTIEYLFTGEESTAVTTVDKTDLKAERLEYDIWTPIWSNLLFLAVILGFTCWQISRWDF